MSAYAVVNLTVTEPSWVREYLKSVSGIVADAGGRYLARTGDYQQVEGDGGPQTIVVIEFPTMEQLEGWYHGEAYRPYRDARQAGSRCDFFLVPGE